MPESSHPLLKDKTDNVMWKLCRIHELFREKDIEVPGQLVSVFCFIASHNPCHMQAIQEALSMSSNSVSRNTDWLSSHHRLGKAGLGLITKKADAIHLRRKILRLTDKGHDMIKQIKEILDGD
jgi:DNA-binding MarR family transcriptional regulator